MTTHRFTIVIPTRNRSTTLHWCLKTCVEQDYDNYEIIVSDNFSVDNTPEVVAAYNSDKIKYYNTGRPLSMSSNWEFALDKVGEGFVLFLGDDDALMPHALSRANHYINEYKVQAVVGRKDIYKWNNVVEVSQRGLLRYEVNRKTKMINSREQLEEVLMVTFDYTKLPCIYDIGFVSMDVIRKIKASTGNVFFHSSIPDIYSSIAIASEIGQYLYANESFVLAGMSSASNGNSFSNPNTDKSVINSFIAENNIPYHPALDFNPSMAATLAESLYQVKDAGIDVPYELPVRTVVELAMQEASYMKFEGTYEVIKKSVEKILLKNGEDKSYYEQLIRKYPYRSWFRRNLKAYLESFHPDRIKNIADYRKIYDNIYEVTLANDALKKNSYLLHNPVSIFSKWVLRYLLKTN